MTSRSYQSIKSDPGTAKTQLVIVTGFLVLAAVFQNENIAYGSLVIGVLSLLIPPAGYGIVWGWYKLAIVLGWINTRVLLSIVYYVLLTPISLAYRLFGNDPMKLKENQGSLFSERNHTYGKEDLENPW